MTNKMLQFWQRLDSNDPLEPLFLAAPILLHSVDGNGAFIRVSQFLADKLGHRVEDMLGLKMLDFLTEGSRAYAEEIAIPAFRKYGSVDAVELDFVRRDGGVLPVVMSAIAEYDTKGTFVRSLAISFDNSKARQIIQDLQCKHRIEAMGELVGGVAHDFNNLLAVVQGNLDFLRQDPDDPEREQLISDAMEATTQGGSLIRQLLTYGRRANQSPTPNNMNAVMETAIRFVQRLFPPNIEIQMIPGKDLWNSHADTALLETALLNLLNNARDAMPGGGQITVETKNADITDGFIGRREGISSGRYVVLSVSDTGHGMDDTVLSKLFDPFFTTKSLNEGSGLGLSMVTGFVQQSNGMVRVESEPDVGTTFRMYFPVEQNDSGPLAESATTKRMLLEEKKVLIVEDDSGVRGVLARQLKDQKIKIYQAETGDGAFQAMDSGLQPDLLLTDIVMPGSLQGPELVQKARSMLPDLRVLFISGYPAEMSEHSADIASFDRQLTKPVSQDKLVAAVMDLLVED